MKTKRLLLDQKTFPKTNRKHHYQCQKTTDRKNLQEKGWYSRILKTVKNWANRDQNLLENGQKI